MMRVILLLTISVCEHPFLSVHIHPPDDKNALKKILFCLFTLLHFVKLVLAYCHNVVVVVAAFSKTSVFVDTHFR